MPKFVIDIDCSNDAFSDDGGKFEQTSSDIQLAVILKACTQALMDTGNWSGFAGPGRYPHNGMTLRDTNGNPVGYARYERDLDLEPASSFR